MKRRVISVFLLLAALLGAVSARAAEAEPVQIHTVEDLTAIGQNPEGSYILMTDLDMSGVQWKPLDFRGSFDGNGHAILNLTLSQPGDTRADSCDGNRKLYDTSYVGLFGTLVDAEIRDLKLLNVRGLVEMDSPVFLAGLAGYARDAKIIGCTVTGTLELRAHDRMFGVGGVVGYGSGTVEDCRVDVTLICTDTDAATKDEQFMGGVYATGFMDVKNCQIVIDGYCSEHGYVHNGGIVGMYMEYPLGTGKSGYIKNNTVHGKITFFEHNADRRAYCKAYVGEALVNRYYLDNNTGDFLRDERYTYDVELRPEMCAEPVYTEVPVEAGCDTYGYTQYTCQGCGYSYTDHYTLFEHHATNWSVTVAATTESEGKSVANCDGCGILMERTDPKLEPVPTTQPPQTTEAETRAPATEPVVVTPGEPESRFDRVFWVAVACDGVLLICAMILIANLRRRKRRR